MDQLIQRLIRWMPLILLFLLFMVDRNKVVHQIGYIVLLLSYTAILILRILYAKKNWHREFSTDDIAKDSKVEKMSDYESKLIEVDNLEEETHK
tara:strand:+ start:424 stop:705 length:282 start_codon:yes stop_codon:yes gene_type:complete